MTASVKLAKDLAAGDRVIVGGSNQEATVLAIVPSVQTLRRKVLMVTVRTKDGRDIHRTFAEYHAVRLVT